MDNEKTKISLAGNDGFLSFINKKVEKIVAAIYIVSNLFSDNEPLKWTLREEGMSLLSLSSDLYNPLYFGHKKDNAMKVVSVAYKVISLLEIGKYAGIVSEMNSRIITEETKKVIEKINEKELIQDKAIMGSVLSEAFFMTEDRDLALESPEKKALNPKQQYARDKNQKTHSDGGDTTKDTRQELIIEMLKKANILGIRDFAKAIKGCSEKTIQRELLSMVKRGVLKKTGERRWSTYSLA